MRARLLIAVILGLWAWVLPIAHTMPIDADGPSGLSDNADFDDLIVRLTSPTAAATPMGVLYRDRRRRATRIRSGVLRRPGLCRRPRSTPRLIFHRTP